MAKVAQPVGLLWPGHRERRGSRLQMSAGGWAVLSLLVTYSWISGWVICVTLPSPGCVTKYFRREMAKMLLRLRAPWNGETSPCLRGKREWKRQRNPHCQESVWVWNLIILPLNPIARIPIDFKRRMIWQHFISSLCTSECIMVSFKPIHLFQPLLEDRVLTAGRGGGGEKLFYL